MGFDGSLDHRVQRDRGVRHDRDARPDDVRGAAVAPGGAGGGADVLRHRHTRAHALRGRSPPRAAPRRWSVRRRWASTRSTSAPSSSTSCSRQQGHGGAGRRRLLRPDDARRRLRRAPRDGARARAARDPRRVHPSRGRPVPARDRHALRRRAEDGRRLHDVPDHGQGVRDEVRLARDVHAEAAVRRERLRNAHASVAVQRRQERVLRPRRPVLPVRRGQGVHRRPAEARARDLLDLRAVGELLQAPGPGLRGAGVRRLVTAQPLGARARAAVSPGHASRRRGWSCAARTRRATRI